MSSIERSQPHLRIVALVDADPHGLWIAATYKNGKRPKQASDTRADVTAPSLEYLGVEVLEVSASFLKYRATDRRCALSLLKHDWIHRPEFVKWKHQIQLGLFLGYKGELNVVTRQDGDRLAQYVRNKLNRSGQPSFFRPNYA